MKKLFAIILMAAFMATGVACTNMSPTQQGVASGAVIMAKSSVQWWVVPAWPPFPAVPWAGALWLVPVWVLWPVVS